jgi:sortase A
MMEPHDAVHERTRKGPLLWLERALWIAGCLGVGWFVVVQAETYVYQEREEARLERELAAAERRAESTAGPRATERSGQTRASGLRELPGEEPEAARVTPPARAAVAPGEAIARLEIPRLGFSAIVADGADHRTLRRAVGHIPATALPGDPGNVGLAGHRDRFFRRLKDVQVDDEITLTTPDGVFHYRVEWTEVVEPADVEVLDDTGEPTLTLVTCYPFYYVGPAPHRYVVRARQVRRELPAAAAP